MTTGPVAKLEPIPRAAGARLPWPAAFLVLTGIWACSFYFIKLGLEGPNPIQVAFGRCLIGALALAAVTAVSRTRLPRTAATWRHLLVMDGA
jgi:drug/metabolite transporter (DMT)-like permease